ncbi:MAG: PTS sugar transporter subunit IIA [Acidobacteriota bacterium]|nr:PTS sugar transporter subunit IIA [Acidobacteriota bacterium]
MKSRVGGVILSHGQMANELLAAAEMILGEIEGITAVSIGWHDDVETARTELERAISSVDQGKGILLLTDLFGGSTTNIAAMFHIEGRIEILTGVNLPMVIRLVQQDGAADLAEIAKQVLQAGREGIYLGGELLVPLKNK